MASTYSTNLALELIGNGDQSGTWGTTTNTNLGTLLEQAISGYVTQAITDGADTPISIPNGASGVARNMYIECTGTLTAARNLVVPANRKLYFIYNNTTGGYAVTVKVSGLTGVSVPNGGKYLLVSNGTDIVNATSYVISSAATSFTATQTFTGSSSTAATVTNNIVETTQLSNTALTGTVLAYLNAGSVFYYNAAAQSGNWTLNFRWSAGTALDSALTSNQTVTVAVIVNQGSTAYYNSLVQIDGTTVTVKWQGGSAPSAGNANSVDVYTYAITKTATNAYLVLGSLTRFA